MTRLAMPTFSFLGQGTRRLQYADAFGRFHASAGAGQLLQVEPGAGRLLSLMSMQHLLQRLTLDFRDVLRQGLSV